MIYGLKKVVATCECHHLACRCVGFLSLRQEPDLPRLVRLDARVKEPPEQ